MNRLMGKSIETYQQHVAGLERHIGLPQEFDLAFKLRDKPFIGIDFALRLHHA